MTNRTINMVIFLLLLILVFETNSKVKTEQDYQKISKSVTAKIERCDFFELGTWGFKVFVGMMLAEASAPYIRFNIPHTERAKYEEWCESHSHVKIRYRIKRTKKELNTTYWGEDIKVVDDDSS